MNAKKIYEKLCEHDGSFKRVEARLDKQDARLEKSDTRQDSFEALLHRLGLEFESQRADLKQTLEIVMHIAARDHISVEKKLENHEDRITVLECIQNSSKKNACDEF